METEREHLVYWAGRRYKEPKLGGLPVNKPIKADEWLDALASRVEVEGPQALEIEGHVPMILAPLDVFRQLERRKPTFLEALQDLGDLSDLDLTRDQSPSREI